MQFWFIFNLIKNKAESHKIFPFFIYIYLYILNKFIKLEVFYFNFISWIHNFIKLIILK